MTLSLVKISPNEPNGVIKRLFNEFIKFVYWIVWIADSFPRAPEQQRFVHVYERARRAAPRRSILAS